MWLIVLFFFSDRRKKKMKGCVGRGVGVCAPVKQKRGKEGKKYEKENDKEMFSVARDVLHTYITRQGRKKRIKMSRRARFIGRDYDADALDRAIKKTVS